MNYTTYYEDSQIVKEEQLLMLVQSIEKKKNLSEIEHVTVRKLPFDYMGEYVQEENDTAGRPIYSLCMKNFDEERLYLEKKSIQNNVVYKSYAALSGAEARKLLCGDVEWLKEHKTALLREFYLQYTLNGLKPGYMVQSQREIRGYRDKGVFIVSRELMRAAFWKEDFFDREAKLCQSLSCDKVRIQYKRPVKIPLAIANIMHTSSEQYSRLVYSL